MRGHSDLADLAFPATEARGKRRRMQEESGVGRLNQSVRQAAAVVIVAVAENDGSTQAKSTPNLSALPGRASPWPVSKSTQESRLSIQRLSPCSPSSPIPWAVFSAKTVT